MGRAERVEDVEVRERGELLCEAGVVVLLLGPEADVLEQKDLRTRSEHVDTAVVVVVCGRRWALPGWRALGWIEGKVPIDVVSANGRACGKFERGTALGRSREEFALEVLKGIRHIGDSRSVGAEQEFVQVPGGGAQGAHECCDATAHGEGP